MSAEDQELIADFVIESQEGLWNVENHMLAIEAMADNVDVELVNSVFRTMHTIKGTAGFLGLDRIGSLAHGLEEVLDNLRKREVIPTPELVSSVLKAADFMKGLIDGVDKSNSADVSVFLEELHQYRPGSDVKIFPKNPPANEPVPNSVVSESTIACNFANDALREFLLESYETLDLMERDLMALETEPTSEKLLQSVFRSMHTIKGGTGLFNFKVLGELTHTAEDLLGEFCTGTQLLTPAAMRALLKTIDQCRNGLKLIESTENEAGFQPYDCLQELKRLVDATAPAAQMETKHEPIPEPASAKSVPKPATIPTLALSNESAGSDKKAALTDSVSDSTIRVDVGLLDKLMTRIGELVLARNQILQRTSESEDIELVHAVQRLNLITSELQEGVMKTRMQPIGNVWSKFPRVIRDLASMLNKQVRLEMEGKETELDKTIIEAIKDPLTHIIRNSVDHGMELPEARIKSGKPAEGVLKLHAFHEGGQVIIEITDDGAGLNIDKIRKKALERGLITQDQATQISDRDAANLVFLPGFSTAEQVTSVSGRGVGMDVVRTNIERIGGTIELRSRMGHGTTVKIQIPLTLAIVPALIVTSGADRFAIPQVNLQELVHLSGEEGGKEIEYVYGAPVYRLRGKLLPIVNLTQQLQLGKKSLVVKPDMCAENSVNIVVLRVNELQFGLLVDQILDTEEIVVKPLSRQLKSLPQYAGAALMGDGNIALILDVLGLATTASVTAEVRERNYGTQANQIVGMNVNAESLLLVELGDARRFALPSTDVVRLEQIAPKAIEYAEGREVIQYRGTILPLIRLTEVFGKATECKSDPDELPVVIYEEPGFACGFVVRGVTDIIKTKLQFQAHKSPDDNLLGTMVINEHVTDVLNLQALARRKAKSIVAL